MGMEHKNGTVNRHIMIIKFEQRQQRLTFIAKRQSPAAGDGLSPLLSPQRDPVYEVLYSWGTMLGKF
jgi:hypothetical protein